MRKLWHPMVRFLYREDGPTAVEYAVMLALIIIVAFTAISVIGTTTDSNFKNINLKTAFSST